MKINGTFPQKKKGLSVNEAEEKRRCLLCKISQPEEIQNEGLGPDMAVVEIQQTQGWQPYTPCAFALWGIAGEITTENEGWVGFRDYSGLEISQCLCCL